MESFYSEDAVFYDPTSERWGEEAFHWIGKRDLIAGFREMVSVYNPKIKYTLSKKYESAGHVVYTGISTVVATIDGVRETSCVAITTIVSVKQGKVVEHRDYVDLETYETTSWVGGARCERFANSE